MKKIDGVLAYVASMVDDELPIFKVIKISNDIETMLNRGWDAQEMMGKRHVMGVNQCVK